MSREGPAYLRRARLTIVKPRPDPRTGIGAFFGIEPTNALEIDGLRVQFEIKKSLGATPNSCAITVTNLAEATRAELAVSPLVAILEVGYGTGELRRLFAGDVFYVAHDLDGADWTTRLQLHDGGRAYAHARVVTSFKAGTTILAAVKAAAAALQVKVPPAVETLPALQRATTAGLTLAGKASDEMSRLLTPFGLGWSIQDGALVVLTEGGRSGIRPGEAILLNEAAGMIGSPKWGNPPKPGQKPPLSVRHLLFPELSPGGLVQVQSRTANGNFKLTDVTHQGDTEGGDWLTSVEAKAVG